jgi:cytochrome c
MDELEISKFVGAGCAAMLAFVGFSEISNALVSVDNLDEPAYSIEVAEEEGAEEEVEAVSVATLMASADASAGERTFRACQACHNIAEGAAAKVGPNLWGIVGRDIAADGGYSYSSALAGIDGAWDWEALNGFLLAPKSWAPGTKMAYNGIKKDGERANLMAYLNEQSGEPIPLPEE